MSERDRSAGVPHPSPDNPIGRFVTRLGKLDAAGRARLKRNTGCTLDQARGVYQVFFAILPQEIRDRATEEDYFLVATLFSIGTRREREFLPNPPPSSLGASLQIVRWKLILRDARHDPDRPISLDRRVSALLNTDRDQLSFRLSQAVRLLAAQEIAINWYQLLRDVQRWDAEPRRVQRRWADDYFRDTTPKANQNAPSSDADEPTSTEEVEL